MGRWQPNARGRLEEAALELYAEHGFEQTTVAEIAGRAGLTERTFFRHFADKREVLFPAGGVLEGQFLDALATVPGDVAPLDALAAVLDAVSVLFDDREELVRKRQAVIDANPGLRERESVKLATLAEALAAGFRARGVPEPAASLTAETGLAVFKVAFTRWMSTPAGPPFPTHLATTLTAFRTLT